jgi:hypothetical protein
MAVFENYVQKQFKCLGHFCDVSILTKNGLGYILGKIKKTHLATQLSGAQIRKECHSYKTNKKKHLASWGRGLVVSPLPLELWDEIESHQGMYNYIRL